MEFDSFAEYYEKLNAYYVGKPGKKPPTKNEVQLIIEEILAAKIKIGKKERRDYYLIKTYDVLCVTDQKFLIYKKTDEDEDIRYVVPYEELYDRIKDFHIKTGHGGIVKLRMSMGHKYKIPRPAIEKFLSVCAICNSKQGANRKLVIKPIVTKDFNERGQVDLVDFQSTPDGKYKWIMNLITVPKVDRGPSDPANVIAVIVNQNEHKLHQLGTQYGLVKGWYNSASLKPATSNFLKITEVNNDKELTLRETVSHISGGQGFLSCICKRQCESKRCACFKASVKCNSRCHSSSICKNK